MSHIVYSSNLFTNKLFVLKVYHLNITRYHRHPHTMEARSTTSTMRMATTLTMRTFLTLSPSCVKRLLHNNTTTISTHSIMVST
jgi:hypothetical protein